jgi:hypothetical protein
MRTGTGECQISLLALGTEEHLGELAHSRRTEGQQLR